MFRRTSPGQKKLGVPENTPGRQVTPRGGRLLVVVHRIVGLGSEEHPVIRGIIPGKIPRPKITVFLRTPRQANSRLLPRGAGSW